MRYKIIFISLLMLLLVSFSSGQVDMGSNSEVINGEVGETIIEIKDGATREYTSNTDKTCKDGKCNFTVYMGRRNVYEVDTWKRIEDVPSLKPYYSFSYIENDPNYEIEVEDFNYTHLKKLKIKSEVQGFIPFNISNTTYISPYFDGGEEIELEDVYVENLFAHQFTLGKESTTIVINGTDNAYGDTYVDSSNGGTNYGTQTTMRVGQSDSKRVYLQFNLTSVPDDEVYTYDTATLYTYVFNTDGTSTISAFHANYDNWTETNVTWDNQPCVDYNDVDCNSTAMDSELHGATGIWENFNVIDMFKNNSKSANRIMSINLRSTGNGDYVDYFTQDQGVAVAPYISLTYTPWVSIYNPEEDSYHNATVTLNITSKQPYNTTIVYSLDGAANVTFAANATSNETRINGLLNGTHWIIAWVNDTSGSLTNITRSENRSFIVDDIKPTVTTPTIAPATAYTDNTLTCTATLIDGEQTIITAYYTWFNTSTAKDINYEVGSTSCNNNSACDVATLSGTSVLEKSTNWTCGVIPGFERSTNGTQENSSVRIISNSIPTVPVLSSPADNSYTSDNSPTFSWSASTDADSDYITYGIEIDDDTGFPAPVVNASYNVSGTSHTPTPMLDDAVYYWHVKSRTDDANSTYTSYWTLTVDTGKPTFWMNHTNTTTPNNNQYVIFNINWTDKFDLDYNILETNITMTPTNFTTQLSSTSQHVNITNFTGKLVDSVYWKSYTNDSAGNWNDTDKMNFTIVDSLGAFFEMNNTNFTFHNLSTQVNHNINWTDNLEVVLNIFETNITGTATNFSSSLSTSSQYVNITNITSNRFAGYYYWKSYTNDSRGNLNQTNQMLVNITDRIAPSYQNITKIRNITEGSSQQFAFNLTEPGSTLVTVIIEINNTASNPAGGNPENITFTAGTRYTNHTEPKTYGEPGNFNITKVYLKDSANNWNVTLAKGNTGDTYKWTTTWFNVATAPSGGGTTGGGGGGAEDEPPKELGETCFINAQCASALCTLDEQVCVSNSCGHDIDNDGEKCDLGETGITCSEDCTALGSILSQELFGDITVANFIIASIVIFLLLYFFVVPPKKKKKKKDKEIKK